MRPPITVVVPCKNEQRHIAACLDSVWDWADEIVVADNGSTDDTLKIVDRYRRRSPDRCRVIQREFIGYGDFKNWAMSHARNDWVLHLDADERLTTEIKEEIDVVLGDHPAYVGYRVRFRTYFLGRVIRRCGWNRYGPIRLMRRSQCRFDDRRIHEGVVVASKAIGSLQSPIEHHTYRSLEHWTDKKNRYTTLGAEELAASGRSARPFRDLLLRPCFRFLRIYLWHGGILDGIPGLIISIDDAFGTFLKYAKLWELHNVSTPAGEDKPENPSLPKPPVNRVAV
ncbi:glycosyltransferase family 2 protein [Thermopirellula anaerolimosa]